MKVAFHDPPFINIKKKKTTLFLIIFVKLLGR